MSCNWTNEDLKLSGLTGTNYLAVESITVE